MAVGGLGEELLLGVKSEGAGVADAADFKVAWIFGWSDLLGIRACGWPPTGCGGFIVESFMRSNFVVSFAEALE